MFFVVTEKYSPTPIFICQFALRNQRPGRLLQSLTSLFISNCRLVFSLNLLMPTSQASVLMSLLVYYFLSLLWDHLTVYLLRTITLQFQTFFFFFPLVGGVGDMTLSKTVFFLSSFMTLAVSLFILGAYLHIYSAVSSFFQNVDNWKQMTCFR